MTAGGASAPIGRERGDGDIDWRLRHGSPAEESVSIDALLDRLPSEAATSAAAESGLLPLLALLYLGLRPRSLLLLGPVDPAVVVLYREAARALSIPARIRIRSLALSDVPRADVDLIHIGGSAARVPEDRWRGLLTPDATIIAEGGDGTGVCLPLQDAVSIRGERAEALLNAAASDVASLAAQLRVQAQGLAERQKHRPTGADGEKGAASLLSRPIGLFGRMRAGLHLAWHSRRHAAALTPLQDIVAEGEKRFRITGPRPLLSLAFDGKVPSGWAVAELWIADADAPLCPALHAQAADGTSSSYYFAVTAAGPAGRLLRLPDHTVTLQLDPSNQPTRFRLDPLTIREVGMGQILLAAARRDGAAVLRSLGHLRRRRSHAAKQEILRAFSGDQPHAYEDWIALFDATRPADQAAIVARIAAMRDPPLISLLLWLDGPLAGDRRDAASLNRTLTSVVSQAYPHWELLLVATSPGLAPDLRAAIAVDARIRVCTGTPASAVVDLARGSFCGRLATGDLLADTALFLAAARLAEEPHTDILYGDEDCVDLQGHRSTPWFKTAWDEERFLAQDYLSRLGLFRRILAVAAGGLDSGCGDAAVYDLLLRLTELSAPARIAHVPFILYHRRVDGMATAPPTSPAARQAAAAALDRRQPGARLEDGELPQWPRLRWPLAGAAPPVTLIVPTRDRVGLLAACLDGLLHKTDHRALEIIVVDNDSREEATLTYLDAIVKDPRVRVLKCPGEFNFSALNNRAVEQARSAYVGFVNNDIEVIEPGWLTEMLSHAVRPGVGAIGAKLLYADGRVQHGGVALGIGGIAGHTERFAPGDSPGYYGDLMLTRNVSCVTAACQIMDRRIFQEIGGFDEALTVALNDVELCVRIIAAGYRIVWTPYARLLHLESVSRGTDLSPEKAQRFRRERAYVEQRWGAFLRSDAFYSPNLSVITEDMSLAFPPRLRRPWLGA